MLWNKTIFCVINDTRKYNEIHGNIGHVYVSENNEISNNEYILDYFSEHNLWGEIINNVGGDSDFWGKISNNEYVF